MTSTEVWKRSKLRRLSIEEKRQWSGYWYSAARNMPRKRCMDHGWTLLATFLRFQLYDRYGRNCAAEHLRTNARRGSRPAFAWQQALLIKLASSDGATLAKALMIKHGYDLNAFKYPPRSQTI